MDAYVYVDVNVDGDVDVDVAVDVEGWCVDAGVAGDVYAEG